MVYPVLFWLPGSDIHPQHRRMKRILGPLMQALSERGFSALARSMIADDFEEGQGRANIWLATDLGEMPPVPGTNILWFLPDMKVMSLVALNRFDGILTSSAAHETFLRAALQDRCPVMRAGWPVALDTMTEPRSDAQDIVQLETASVDAPDTMVRIKDLPADPEHLTAYFQGFRTVRSCMSLRERMCGFVRYEEIVALLAGCQVVSDTRAGLPGPVADMLNTSPICATIDAFLHYFTSEHHPDTIADAIVRMLDRALDEPRAMTHTAEMITPPREGRGDELSALLADAAYVLAHPVCAELSSKKAWSEACDLTLPWSIARSGIDRDAAPLPWTDLSFLRCVLDAAHDGRVTLGASDLSRIGTVVRLLHNVMETTGIKEISVASLTDIPWSGVANATLDRKRIFLDLSRQLNGHCLYRFTQRAARAPKPLSPVIPSSVSPADEFLAKSAIFYHAFYVDETLANLRNMATALRRVPIYLTTDTREKQLALKEGLDALGWAQFQIRKVENVGRDIYPKLVAMAALHADHEFVLHLHSKRSPHSPSLADWGKASLMQLASSDDLVRSIAAAFANDPGLGMVYPEPPTMLHPAIAWIRNLRLAEMAARVCLPPDQDLEFPVGSMFWARTAAIKPLLDAPLSAAHFAGEAGQEDGTLAHALERLLGVSVVSQGFTLRTSKLHKT